MNKIKNLRRYVLIQVTAVAFGLVISIGTMAALLDAHAAVTDPVFSILAGK